MTIKRLPDIATTGPLRRRYDAISKADWAELYADLYRGTGGRLGSSDWVTDEEWITDAEARLAILREARR